MDGDARVSEQRDALHRTDRKNLDRDHLRDEHGKHLASWDQVVHLTKKEKLRPTLPDDMDREFEALISDCWHDEPALRPSFSVVLFRLQGIGLAKSFHDRNASANFEDTMDSAAKELCRGLNGLLWDYVPAQWDQSKATAMISADATITARDSVLSKIVGSEKGPGAVKALGSLMFAGLEDGAEIRPEPVLETDITVSRNPGQPYALLKSRFALIAPEKIKQWRVKDTREFDGLQAALLASEQSIESWGTGTLGAAATADDSNDNGEQQKKPTRRRTKRRKKKKPKKDARVENFIKAARFVRGYGAAAIHPSAKIELHGLRMQALKGDCPDEASAQGGASSMRSLEELKLDAWRSVQGKSQEVAMEEYLSLLTSLAPDWKVAHIVLGRQTKEERRKPREMMWVLKVGYVVPKKEEALAAASISEAERIQRQKTPAIYRTRGLQVTSIEILQSSNGANARLWSTNQLTLQRPGKESGRGVKSGAPLKRVSEMDAYISKLPKDLTISDCIIDRDEHSTM